MTTINQLKTAMTTAQSIIDGFKAIEQPDVLEAKRAELQSLTKAELIEKILTLEKPKADKTVKVEDVAKALLENPDCALLTYEQIATLVQAALPEAKTTSKSIASYASKRKDEWNIVTREKFKMSQEDLISLAV